MNPDTVELARRLANMVRHGTIHSVDLAAARCRVQSGAIVTGWLPWLAQRAGTTRTWSPPTVGEQCTVLAAGGDLGAGVAVLGGYSQSSAAPSALAEEHVTLYPDGTRVAYNHATHALTIAVAASGTVAVTCGTATLEADTVTVQADAVTVQADTASITAGTVNIQGGSGDVVVSGISLVNHTHGGVKAGIDSTGGPQ